MIQFSAKKFIHHQGVCKYKCAPDRICGVSEGPCRGLSSVCEDTTFNVCQNDICTNTNVFPTADYPTHASRFISSDDCCTRRCHWAYNRCGDGVVGCVEDRDCAHGLYCETNNGQDPVCYHVTEYQITFISTGCL